MFRFASNNTMNEIASDASIVDVDASIGAGEGEIDPMDTILIDMNAIASMVEDPEPPTTTAPLDKSSLHTTCSDASINLDTYRQTVTTKDSVALEDAAELSFHVSQLQNSSAVLADSTGLDLTLLPGSDNDGVSEVNNDSNVPDNTSSSDDVKHDMETLISVSQQLLQMSPSNPSTTIETTKKGSILKCHKYFVIFAIIAGGLARSMDCCPYVHVTLSKFVSAWTKRQAMDTIMIREDNINLIVGDLEYRKEEMDSSSNNHTLGMWQVIVLGMMAKLALSNTKKCERKSNNIRSDQVGSFTSEINTTRAGKSRHESAPVKASVKVQDENLPAEEKKYDLSKYEKLTVTELRALLRSRRCTYDGRKVHLIQRLVAVYRAELESMTVVQLRRRMKSKNMKQGGLKRELVQKLIEAGL